MVHLQSARLRATNVCSWGLSFIWLNFWRWNLVDSLLPALRLTPDVSAPRLMCGCSFVRLRDILVTCGLKIVCRFDVLGCWDTCQSYADYCLPFRFVAF